MDYYIEELMPKNKDKNDWMFIIGIILCGITVTALIACFFVYMVFSKNSIFTQFVITLSPLAIAGVWYGVYKICNSKSVEYEYTVINNHIDIDKILAKKIRKKLISIDIKNATAMAKVKELDFASLPSRIKIYDYSALNKNLDTYYIDCMADGERCVVLFQPTSGMVEALWKFNPKAVKRENI